MNRGMPMDRASGQSSLLRHPNAKFFDETGARVEEDGKTETSGATEALRKAGR
jgi:hypothetical protein